MLEISGLGGSLVALFRFLPGQVGEIEDILLFLFLKNGVSYVDVAVVVVWNISELHHHRWDSEIPGTS